MEEEERTWAARSGRTRNLQNLGEQSLPVRRALGPQVPGRGGVWGWAGPSCAEARRRSRVTRAGGGGALLGLARDARPRRLARLFTSTRACYF